MQMCGRHLPRFSPHPAAFFIDDPGEAADALTFAEGVRPEDLVVRTFADQSVVIGITEEGLVMNGGLTEDQRIEWYCFDNGTKLSFNQLLALQQGTESDDLLIMVREGYDLIIGLTEEDVELASLFDVVTFQGWYKEQHRIERIVFSDSSILDITDMLRLSGQEPITDPERFIVNPNHFNVGPNA